MTNGIVVDGYEQPVTRYLPAFKALNITTVRVWGAAIDPAFADANWYVRNCKPWRDAGIKVITCLTFRQSSTAPSVSDATKYFAKVNKWLAGCTDYVEIGNEWLLSKYASFANAADFGAECVAYTKAARECLPGYKLVACPMTYGASAQVVVDHTKAMLDAGLAQYVDYGNVHLYASDAAGVVARAQGVKALYQPHGLPVWCTEWNLDTTDQTKWRTELPKAVAGIAPYIDVQCYYRAHVTDTPGSRDYAYPLNKDGTPSAAFATVQQAFTQTAPTPTPTPTGAGTVGVTLRNSHGTAVDGTVTLLRADGSTYGSKATANGYAFWSNVPYGSYTAQVGTSTAAVVLNGSKATATVVVG